MTIHLKIHHKSVKIDLVSRRDDPDQIIYLVYYVNPDVSIHSTTRHRRWGQALTEGLQRILQLWPAADQSAIDAAVAEFRQQMSMAHGQVPPTHPTPA